MDWLHDGWFAVWHWIVEAWDATPDSLGPPLLLGVGASFGAIGGFVSRRVEVVRTVRARILEDFLEDFYKQAAPFRGPPERLLRRGEFIRVCSVAGRRDSIRGAEFRDAFNAAMDQWAHDVGAEVVDESDKGAWRATLGAQRRAVNEYENWLRARLEAPWWAPWRW